MKRLLILTAALVVAIGAFAPVALAAEPLGHSGRVLVSTHGDVIIPAGEQADVVVVVSGAAHIQGVVNTLVVVDGTADLQAATLETVAAVRSHVEVGDQTTIYGDIRQLDSTIYQTGSTDIHGGITDLANTFLQMGVVLGPALVMLWLGFGLATIVAGLLVAGVAGRQVRKAEQLISGEPLITGLTGLLTIVVVPIVAIILMATIVGAPLGLGILLGALPLVAFAGYLVAAIWVGDLILRRAAPATEREHPYLASVVGVLVLMALGLVPVLGLISAVASLLGLGAVLRLAFRAIRGTPRPFAPAPNPMAAPTRV